MASSETWITLGRTLDQATGIIRSLTREVYVGSINGELAGFVVLLMSGILVGFVQSLVVKRALQNQGIDTALMNFAEGRILKELPNVFLCVFSFNE